MGRKEGRVGEGRRKQGKRAVEGPRIGGGVRDREPWWGMGSCWLPTSTLVLGPQGLPCAGVVQKFLDSVLPACGDLSFQQDQMTQTYGFRDPEIT